MSELITISKDIWKRLSAQKGQGLVEFALVLAFCAGIGVAAREAGFAEAISNLLDRGEQTEDVAAAIGGPSSVDRLTYGKYLAKWGKKTSDELAAIRNEERITGDQKGLVAIAETFLGKSANEVQDQMKIFDDGVNKLYNNHKNDLKLKIFQINHPYLQNIKLINNKKILNVKFNTNSKKLFMRSTNSI